ncbi:MAG: CpaF family protein [Armatimonadetes bacterium]|nr:CpaF family protein [Armatimonadota bacterium]
MAFLDRSGDRALADELRQRVHQRLLVETEFPVLQRMGTEDLRARIAEILESELSQRQLDLPARLVDQLHQEVMDEVVGYGPIQSLIEAPEITEIMVNGPHRVYVEIAGRIHLTDRRFVDDEHVLRIIDRIVAPLGRRVDESMPMVDARLPDGSRVNAIIPPLALNGPCLTIRKFSRTPLTPAALVDLGTLSEEMRIFLEASVQARLNILVSGGTGSGKTTTLNALSSFVPEEERIITIEDAAELQLQQEHVISLESRPPNIEGKGEITIRQLVRNALRMRPDRIIVGEVRGAEALDMLQAMNTGHDGSMSTLHANSPRDALARLETMVLMAGTELPSRAIREQISSALHLIVHQARLRDGSRKITHITEVQRMEGDHITLQDLFVYRQRGVDRQGRVVGEHVATGATPLFIEIFEAEGVPLPLDVFAPPEMRR